MKVKLVSLGVVLKIKSSIWKMMNKYRLMLFIYNINIILGNEDL